MVREAPGGDRPVRLAPGGGHLQGLPRTLVKGGSVQHALLGSIIHVVREAPGGGRPVRLAPGGGHLQGLPRTLVKGGRVQHKINLMLDTTPFYQGAVSPINGSHLGPILQAWPPPGAASNHVTDRGFEPKTSSPVALQHTAIPPTWAVQRHAATLLELRTRVRSPHQSRD